MLNKTVTENILGQVWVQLEMTSHDWERLKASDAWDKVEQILLESERESTHYSPRTQTDKVEVVHSTNNPIQRFFYRLFF